MGLYSEHFDAKLNAESSYEQCWDLVAVFTGNP